MSKINRLAALFFLFPLLMCFEPNAGAAGESGTSRASAEIRGFSAGSLGLMYGWRVIHYASDYFTIGGAGFTGQIPSEVAGQSGSFSYGGLVTGFNMSFGKRVGLEINLLAGGGGGSSGGVAGGGIVLEPHTSLDFKLGESVSLNLGGGYVYTAGNTNMSGASFGLAVGFAFTSEESDKVAKNTSAPAVPAFNQSK